MPEGSNRNDVTLKMMDLAEKWVADLMAKEGPVNMKREDRQEQRKQAYQAAIVAIAEATRAGARKYQGQE